MNEKLENSFNPAYRLHKILIDLKNIGFEHRGYNTHRDIQTDEALEKLFKPSNETEFT